MLQKLIARFVPSKHLQVDANRFQKSYETGNYKVIDVRTDQELAKRGVLFPGTIHFDFHSPDFQKNLESLDRTQPYLIYCGAGVRSRKAQTMMKPLGFAKVVELKGGTMAWDQNAA